jgi:paraquat-inducible protein A
MPENHSVALCSRCGHRVYYRKPQSLSMTWSLVLTGFVLLVMANVYPIMTVSYLGSQSTDTIISGVIALIDMGMFAIAMIVFIASIAVPLLKLLALVILLLMVENKVRLSQRQSAMAYRIVEIIGKWSMLDLFVVSILVTMVDLGGIASISAGTGATAFSAVVVVTMLAAHAFDPKLIWDLESDVEPSYSNTLKEKS